MIVGAEQQVAEVAQKVAKEKYGLDVELVTFNDYVLPNEALSKGDIDLNAFQHKPYRSANQRSRLQAGAGRQHLCLPDCRLLQENQIAGRAERRLSDRTA